MAKIGYAPKWGSFHSKVVDDFEGKKGDQAKVSRKFDDPREAMEWLNGTS